MAHGNGSFGWVAEIKGKIIATGRGEAGGSKKLMQSFRAEGYGMLAAVTFLKQAYTHNGWPQTNKQIKIICDNLGLIQRIKWNYERTTKTPKEAMAADYDLEAEITSAIDTMERNNVSVSLKHVKGHQDRVLELHQMTREAQLNVEADKEATKALNNHRGKEQYSQMPATRAMLYINAQPITSKETENLRSAYLSQNLRSYMIVREEWKDRTPDTIWWEPHKRAIKKLNGTNKTRIQKFIHRGLPTNKKLNDQDKEHPTICPSCSEIETNEHVQCCMNPKRVAIRKTTRNNITRNMEKYDVHIQIKECFLLGMEQWTQNQTTRISKQDLSFTPEGEIEKAIDEQNEIGWGNFTRGRLSIRWEDIQARRYTERKAKEKHKDPTIWATSMITTMWNGFLQTWESRNDDQHGRDEATKVSKERTSLMRRINRIYEMRDQLGTEDKRFFKLNEEEWETRDNKEISEWLTIAEPLTNEGVTRARTKANNQSLITSFFERRPRDKTNGFSKIYNKRPPRGGK